MEIRELTCVCCPVGCALRAELENGVVARVLGNGCPRGEPYARQEAVAPVRVVTGSALLRGGALARVPVKTDAPVPKSRIFAVMDAIRALSVCAPVRAGEVLIKNVAGTGARLVATREMAEAPAGQSRADAARPA